MAKTKSMPLSEVAELPGVRHSIFERNGIVEVGDRTHVLLVNGHLRDGSQRVVTVALLVSGPVEMEVLASGAAIKEPRDENSEDIGLRVALARAVRGMGSNLARKARI